MKRFVSIIACLILGGCTSQPSVNPLKPWTLFTQHAAAKVEQAETKRDAAQDALVHQAHVEVIKANAAATLAKPDAPNSRGLDLAIRSSGNAVSALNQVEPLTVGELEEQLKLARDYVSDSQSARADAERRQALAEGKLSDVSKELADRNSQIETLQKASKAEAAKNAELANELKEERWYKWGGVALSAATTIAALMYRANFGNLQVGVANGLAALHTKYGATDEDVAALKGAIAAKTSNSTQDQLLTLIGKIVAK